MCFEIFAIIERIFLQLASMSFRAIVWTEQTLMIVCYRFDTRSWSVMLNRTRNAAILTPIVAHERQHNSNAMVVLKKSLRRWRD